MLIHKRKYIYMLIYIYIYINIYIYNSISLVPEKRNYRSVQLRNTNGHEQWGRVHTKCFCPLAHETHRF